jgi:hypothetical protein
VKALATLGRERDCLGMCVLADDDNLTAPSARPHDCFRRTSVTKVEMSDLTSGDLQLRAGVILAGMNPIAAFA